MNDRRSSSEMPFPAGLPHAEGMSEMPEPFPRSQYGPGFPGYMPTSMLYHNATLWMGDLEPWMDEEFIWTTWTGISGQPVHVRIIDDRAWDAGAFPGPKHHAGSAYCFVTFANPMLATLIFQNWNYQPIPGTNGQKYFKLGWAAATVSRPVAAPADALGTSSSSALRSAAEYSIFCGDLTTETSEEVLFDLFAASYPSCTSAKIMADPLSGHSRGYGFVRFSDQREQQKALSEMQGVPCGGRPMRISTATPKSKQGLAPSRHLGPSSGDYLPRSHYARTVQLQSPYLPVGHMQSSSAMPVGSSSHIPYYNGSTVKKRVNDPNNTTVFVGGLHGDVQEADLEEAFQSFGEIIYVKIPPGRGCGFVHFVSRQSAEASLDEMQGFQLRGSRLRLSWGHSQSDKRFAAVASATQSARANQEQVLALGLHEGPFTAMMPMYGSVADTTGGLPGPAAVSSEMRYQLYASEDNRQHPVQRGPDEYFNMNHLADALSATAEKPSEQEDQIYGDQPRPTMQNTQSSANDEPHMPPGDFADGKSTRVIQSRAHDTSPSEDPVIYGGPSKDPIPGQGAGEPR